jgi:flagellar motor switch protein FliG
MSPQVSFEDHENLRRAAIIIAALGEDLAGEVCSQLPPGQILALGDELAALQEVPTAELNQVLAEFLGRLQTSASLGGRAYARSVMGSALGNSGGYHNDDIGLTILGRLDDIDATVLWGIVRAERQQTIAALVTHLSATNAGALLSFLDEETAADIAYRAAHLATPSPGAMQALGEALEMQLRATRTRSGSTQEVSLQFVVDLIGSMSPNRGQQLLAALQQLDGSFGESVAEQVFTFEDLARLVDHDLQLVLRAVDLSVVVMALKGSSAELRKRIKQNLSQRVQERLEEELDLLGAVPLSQVHEAQRQVCHQAHQLADAGEIGLTSGSEQYVQ